MKSIWNKDNLLLAFNRIITNPESTYKNYFRDAYSAYGLALNENITALMKKKSGYLPTKPVRAFLPKANGLTRMYTLLPIEDQIVYQAYGNIIADYLFEKKDIRKRYKKTVFGNLYAGKESPFFYQKWQRSYSAYTRAIKMAHSDGYEYMASFDLTACYDSINHELLSYILNNRLKLDFTFVKDFLRLLQCWMSEEPELTTGIPQGPLTSGIVSEVVLSSYDDKIELLQKKLDFHYFRYVDDIRVLGKDEDTVKWVLFLLDKRSKELGLFPQASKITVHKVDDIDKEIKSISKPLFDADVEEEGKGEVAALSIRKLLRSVDEDTTSIKRYFNYVDQNTKTNAVAIAAIQKYPNLIHSFAYYVKRYPRKVPKKISDYIYDCCNDKTRQFTAGLLLESVMGNLRKDDEERFLEFAHESIAKDNKEQYIVDVRFQVQLLLLILKYDLIFARKYQNYLKKCNWWVRSNLLYQASKYHLFDKIGKTMIEKSLINECVDTALPVAYEIVLSGETKYLPPKRTTMSPVAQLLLKQAGIIQRRKIQYTQINKYIAAITGDVPHNFQWKKRLGKEHAEIERKIFTALGYWKTDLTGFVNIWDTIDDKILTLLTKGRQNELGGYNEGTVGCIKDSKKLKKRLPKFHAMCMEIHELRRSSQLSHYSNYLTKKYTGPIPQSKRKRIVKLIKEGYDEIQQYWTSEFKKGDVKGGSQSDTRADRGAFAGVS